MLQQILSHLPTLWTVVSGFIGGGSIVALIKAYRAYWTQRRKGDAQEHDQDIELSEHLSSRLSKVEGRLDTAEKEVRETKKQLTESQIREDELQAAIDALVRRIDKLIDRLEEHEQITEEERDRLTSVPYRKRSSNKSSQSSDSTE